MEQGNINIYEQLMIFYRRKWMLIIPFFIGITLASLAAYLLPAYYRSTTLILVEAQQIPDTYVKSTNMSPIEEQLNTIKQQVMSRTKLEEIIGSFNLYKKEDSNKIRWNSLLKVIGIGQSWILTKEDKVEIMRKTLKLMLLKILLVLPKGVEVQMHLASVIRAQTLKQHSMLPVILPLFL